MNKKVVLAYSGGLDTSIILKWLANQEYEVICFVGNVGQKEDFEAVEKKAFATGASKVYTEDLRKEFVTDYIFPALKGNALYEGQYLLGTSLARPILAKKQIEIARIEGAEYVSHGSTGKGNDQVRFELGYYALNPDIKVIAPWKDPVFLEEFKGRTDMINYAKKYDIEITASKKRPYSEDENLMHISHEAGILEDPSKRPNDDVFTISNTVKNAPDSETLIEITFENGTPLCVKNLDDGTEKRTENFMERAYPDLEPEELYSMIAFLDKDRVSYGNSLAAFKHFSQINENNIDKEGTYVIIDDMFVSARTANDVSKILKQLGANRVEVWTSHPVTSLKQHKTANDRTYIDHVVCLDTIPQSPDLNIEYINASADLLAAELYKSHQKLVASR